MNRYIEINSKSWKKANLRATMFLTAAPVVFVLSFLLFLIPFIGAFIAIPVIIMSPIVALIMTFLPEKWMPEIMKKRFQEIEIA